uniref:Uncharacterized protein n=1 Tax=Arundo donax TaxID=35708 RepID=A0A0A9FGT8_ARUDO
MMKKFGVTSQLLIILVQSIALCYSFTISQFRGLTSQLLIILVQSIALCYSFTISQFRGRNRADL